MNPNISTLWNHELIKKACLIPAFTAILFALFWARAFYGSSVTYYQGKMFFNQGKSAGPIILQKREELLNHPPKSPETSNTNTKEKTQGKQPTTLEVTRMSRKEKIEDVIH